MNIWTNRVYVHCAPINSKLTLGSCRTNQEQALIGACALLAGESVNLIPEHQIERIMECGECEHCKVQLPLEQVKRKLQGEFERIANSLENFDWYRYDSDIRQERRSERARQGWQRQLRARERAVV